MMTVKAANYAKVLFSLNLDEACVRTSLWTIIYSQELLAALENPIISKKNKEAVIDRIFDKEICAFLKVLCANKSIGLASSILESYEEMILNKNNKLEAKLSYVTEPDNEEIEQIKTMLCNKYGKAGVKLELEEDETVKFELLRMYFKLTSKTWMKVDDFTENLKDEIDAILHR